MRKIPYQLSGLMLVLVLVGITTWQVVAQFGGVWSPQEKIPDYQDERPPLLIADRNHTVHAFNAVPINETTVAFYYRQWTLDRGWTPSVDFLITSWIVNRPLLGVFLDPADNFHMVYYAGSQEAGAIYYTQANASEASRSQSWSKPVVLAENAGPLASAAILGDLNGNLVVVYSGQTQGIGVYEIHSNDAGRNWSAPRPVSHIRNEEQWPTSIRLELDELGQVHCVWSVVNVEGVGVEVLYARLPADYSAWNEPVQLAKREEGEYSTTWPAIKVHANLLMVIYQDSFPATRWMRLSRDGGATWLAPVRPFEEIGEYENPVLLEDSAGNLHMLLGNRTALPEIHGMWHSMWIGERWSELEAVVSGPLTSEFDPSAPQAVISQGNVLLVSWWNNVQAAEVAMYSYTVLGTPPLPVQTLTAPTSEAVGLSTAQPEETQQNSIPPSPTAIAALAGASSRPMELNPALVVLMSILPVIGLLGVVYVFRRLINRRK